MRAHGSILAVHLLAVAGCAVPQPGGAGVQTRHYEIRTDVRTPVRAELAGRTAEQVHLALEQQFGVPVEGRFPVVVFGSRAAFEAALSPPLRGRGFVGECGSRCAIVYWPDDQRGQDTLAHELVHHFVEELLPGLPYWLDEGLAKTLAPKRSSSPTEWLALVNELTDPELVSHLRSREDLPEGPDYAVRCMVAAAVARFALETEPFRDLRGLARWQVDERRFVAWLRGRRWAPYRRFQPVLDSQD